MLSLCASLAFAQEGVTKDTIYLGTSLPSTGPVAPACIPQNEGAQAWFRHVNAGGGIHGRKIENIVLDDGYKAPEALANARELAAKPILAFFSGCGSIQPPGILPIAQQNGIPYLYPNAGTQELMTSKIAFTLLPTYGQLFESLIQYLIKKDGGKVRVYAVLADVPGAQQAVDGLTRAVAEAGGEFVGSVVMNPAATDYTPVVLKMKDMRPDYVATNRAAAPRRACSTPWLRTIPIRPNR
jgi:ABC-type branched-subunit amino acid transport system substrate-binding protein